MRDFLIIRIVSKMLIPLLSYSDFMCNFHGDLGPGGGFQAGVIVASAFIYTVWYTDSTQQSESLQRE